MMHACIKYISQVWYSFYITLHIWHILIEIWNIGYHELFTLSWVFFVFHPTFGASWRRWQDKLPKRRQQQRGRSRRCPGRLHIRREQFLVALRRWRVSRLALYSWYVLRWMLVVYVLRWLLLFHDGGVVDFVDFCGLRGSASEASTSLQNASGSWNPICTRGQGCATFAKGSFKL